MFHKNNIRKKINNNFVYRFLVFGNDLINKIFKNRKLFFVLLILFLILAFFVSNFKKYFFTILLIVIASLSFLPQRYFKFFNYIGFEFCMMSVVLITLSYGRIYGVFSAFVSITAGYILSGSFKPSSFISIFALPFVAFIIPFFNAFNLSIFYLGILMTIIYDIIILPLYLLMGSRFYTTIIFFITHIIFNAWVFTFIAPFVFSIMH